MTQILDALWRASLYCLLPRVILLSLMPLLLAGTLASVLAYFYWEGAIEGVRVALEASALLGPALAWLDQFTGGIFRSVIGPLVVVALAVPVLLIMALLLVSAFMGSAIVRLVAVRRFPALEAYHGGAWWQSVFWTLGATLVALLVLAVTLPLWLIPPLALLLPPLIWGWLSYRVMSFDAVAEHASADERRALLREHHWPLLAMGVMTGYLGVAPSLIWALLGAFALPFTPLLAPVFVWLYTLIFAFSALWFTHYLLAALERLRRDRLRAVTPIVAEPVEGVSPPSARAGGTNGLALPGTPVSGERPRPLEP